MNFGGYIMGILDYIKDKKKLVKTGHIALFSAVMSKENNKQPEEICFIGLFNNDKTRIKNISTGEIYHNIDGWYFTEDERTAYVETEIKKQVTIKNSKIYTFSSKDKISYLDNFSITQSNNSLTIYNNTYFEALSKINSRHYNDLTSIATCKKVAKFINSTYKKQAGRKKQQTNFFEDNYRDF